MQLDAFLLDSPADRRRKSIALVALAAPLGAAEEAAEAAEEDCHPHLIATARAFDGLDWTWLAPARGYPTRYASVASAREAVAAAACRFVEIASRAPNREDYVPGGAPPIDDDDDDDGPSGDADAGEVDENYKSIGAPLGSLDGSVIGSSRVHDSRELAEQAGVFTGRTPEQAAAEAAAEADAGAERQRRADTRAAEAAAAAAAAGDNEIKRLDNRLLWKQLDRALQMETASDGMRPTPPLAEPTSQSAAASAEAGAPDYSRAEPYTLDGPPDDDDDVPLP